MEAKIKFVAVDMPVADPFMLHIYAAVAEQEARAISRRTKAALASAKARGARLGQNGDKLGAKNKEAAIQQALKLKPLIEDMRAQGVVSVRGITNALNARREATVQGKRWHSTSVHRLLIRIAKLAA